MFLASLFFLFNQGIFLVKELAYKEEVEIKSKIKKEVSELEILISALNQYIEENSDDRNWSKEEVKNKLTVKLRNVDYKNLFILTLINDIRNDTSLNVIRGDSGGLAEFVVWANNIYLTSNRISEGVHVALFIKEMDWSREFVLQRDFNLFYEFFE